MARSFGIWLVLGVLILSFVVIPVGITEGQKNTKPVTHTVSAAQIPETPAPKSGPVCRVYSLGDLGADPALAQWVAETIQQVIEPGSWSYDGSGKHNLTYSASTNVLVVYHVPPVQAKVEAFLAALTKGMAAAKQVEKFAPATWKAKELTPAQYVVPQSAAPQSASAPYESGYPVAAPKKAPKHLFHFIIRYEGEGIIDSNVVEFMKAQTLQNLSGSGSVNANFPPISVPNSGGTNGLQPCMPITGSQNSHPPATLGAKEPVTVAPGAATVPPSSSGPETMPGPKANPASPTPKNIVPKGLDGAGC
jgi:hypothetical protein